METDSIASTVRSGRPTATYSDLPVPEFARASYPDIHPRPASRLGRSPRSTSERPSAEAVESTSTQWIQRGAAHVRRNGMSWRAGTIVITSLKLWTGTSARRERTPRYSGSTPNRRNMGSSGPSRHGVGRLGSIRRRRERTHRKLCPPECAMSDVHRAEGTPSASAAPTAVSVFASTAEPSILGAPLLTASPHLEPRTSSKRDPLFRRHHETMRRSSFSRTGAQSGTTHYPTRSTAVTGHPDPGRQIPEECIAVV